jgi:predicted RNA binding protein YcfA (HicA-like mRNA interferase family)
MAKTYKLTQTILQGRSDASIGFEELRSMLKSLGFEERIRGSHHIYRRADVEERLNLQRESAKANGIVGAVRRLTRGKAIQRHDDD